MSRRPHTNPANDRKTLQLCAQVRRALELTIAGELDDPMLDSLALVDVRPAPDASRLAARFVVPRPAPGDEIPDPSELHARLERARPLLIEAVAQAISRRKTPELAFEFVLEPPAGAADPGLG